MPSRSVPIRDGAGKVIGIACTRERRAHCATAGCRGDAVLLCDFPVTRRGKPTRCNRHVCRRCAKAVGKREHFCPPHARTAGNAAEHGAVVTLVTICSACLSSSCAHRDDGYVCDRRAAAGTRTVTMAQWLSMLSFGVLK